MFSVNSCRQVYPVYYQDGSTSFPLVDEQRTDKFISVFEGGHMARSGTVLDISLVSVDGLCDDAPFFQEIGGNF